MRLVQRPPETPSLETWLSRDVPHEREMAGELLEKMGRENALAALLVIHDREETKRQKRRRFFRFAPLFIFGVSLLILLAGSLPLHLIHAAFATALSLVLNLTAAFVSLIGTFLGYTQSSAVSRRQKGLITALFAYDNSPLIAEPLCLALTYYDDARDLWALFIHLGCALERMPDDREALTKEARLRLRNRIPILEIEEGPQNRLTPEQETDRARQADFEIAVLHYFARTKDKAALRAIRKLARAKTYSYDGVRVRDAARAALQAFGETGA